MAGATVKDFHDFHGFDGTGRIKARRRVEAFARPRIFQLRSITAAIKFRAAEGTEDFDPGAETNGTGTSNSKDAE